MRAIRTRKDLARLLSPWRFFAVLGGTLVLIFLVAFAGKAIQNYRIHQEAEALRVEVEELKSEKARLNETRAYAQTDSYASDPQELYDRIKRNEDLVSVWLMPDIALQRDRHGYPFAWVLPPNTPVLTEGIAIVKDAPNPDRAKQFYDFVTTPEALAHQAEAYSKVPTRNDLDPATLPEWMTAQQIDAQDIDWAVFAEHETTWFDQWESKVYNAP